MDGEIEPRGNAAGGQHVAVVDHAGVDHLGTSRPEVVDRTLMSDRRPPVEQSRPSQEHPAGTDAGDGRAAVVGCRQQFGQLSPFGFRPRAVVPARVPPTTGDDQEVGVDGS